MRSVLIAFLIISILLFGCAAQEIKTNESETKNKTEQKNEIKVVEIEKNENLSLVMENKTENETIEPIKNETTNEQKNKNMTLKLNETITIDGKLYTFCDYSHRGSLAVTKIAFCEGTTSYLGFHALVGQQVNVGNTSVLVTKFVPRDNVKNVPEVTYIELIISPIL